MSKGKRAAGGRWAGDLTERVHQALADCPRTAGEIARYLGVDRADVGKALSHLVRRGRVWISQDPDPENGHKVYEVAIP